MFQIFLGDFLPKYLIINFKINKEIEFNFLNYKLIKINTSFYLNEFINYVKLIKDLNYKIESILIYNGEYMNDSTKLHNAHNDYGTYVMGAACFKCPDCGIKLNLKTYKVSHSFVFSYFYLNWAVSTRNFCFAKNCM